MEPMNHSQILLFANNRAAARWQAIAAHFGVRMSAFASPSQQKNSDPRPDVEWVGKAWATVADDIDQLDHNIDVALFALEVAVRQALRRRGGGLRIGKQDRISWIPLTGSACPIRARMVDGRRDGDRERVLFELLLCRTTPEMEAIWAATAAQMACLPVVQVYAMRHPGDRMLNAGGTLPDGREYSVLVGIGQRSNSAVRGAAWLLASRLRESRGETHAPEAQDEPDDPGELDRE